MNRIGLLAVCLLSLALWALATPRSVAGDPPSSQPADPLTAGFTLMPLDFEVQHPYDLKLEDRYKYDKATDTHDLWVLITDKPHAPPPNTTAPRTEIRIKDETYKPNTGVHLLSCDLYIVPGTFACISQVFGTGPMAMIVVNQQGTIEDLRARTVIARDMNGKWFNWKVFHDTGAQGNGAIKIFVDNKLADGNINARSQDSYYFKIGVYSREGSNHNEVGIRHLQYWVKKPADPPATQPQENQ